MEKVVRRVEIVAIKSQKKIKNYGQSDIKRFIYFMQEEGLSFLKLLYFAVYLVALPMNY